MKQNNIVSDVKRNNNSEGVDGNEQCSSNAKEAQALHPKRTKCNLIAKIKKWDDTYLRYGFFLLDDQILNVQEQPSH